MRIHSRISLVILVWFVAWVNKAEGQDIFVRIPTVILGGSAGYYRASLDNFLHYYDSRWGGYFSAQTNLRVYRMNYLSLQYAKFQKEQTNKSLGKAEWDQHFINLGIRWYYEGRKRWRNYAGFGFTFVTIHERPEFSLLSPQASDKTTTHGSGFFLEIGWDYIVLSPLALNLEFEVSSAGEGGNPGIAGSSLGGYALLAGILIHF